MVCQELQKISSNWRTLKEAESRYVSTKHGLTTIAGNDGAEIMVPLTPSLYVPGTVADTEKVLVDIGTGYFVEKNVADAQSLIDRKVAMVVGNADNLQAVARQKQKNLEVIMDVMRMRLRQPERQPEAR
jgi:prefoldin alpha subunit